MFCVFLTFGERDGGVLGVDGVENALITNLRLTDQTDLTADIRRAAAHPHTITLTKLREFC